jgi:hypothetical protein
MSRFLIVVSRRRSSITLAAVELYHSRVVSQGVVTFCNRPKFCKTLRNVGLKMAMIAYARVSTRDQDLTGQIEALKAAGAKTIYREKVSGARADRPQLAKLMAGLKAGDFVVVTKLDRLGRSTRELLDLIDRIGKAGASFRSAIRSGIRRQRKADCSRRSWPPSPSSSASLFANALAKAVSALWPLASNSAASVS